MSYKLLTNSQFASFRQTMIAMSPTSISPWRCACGNGATCPMLLDDLWAIAARGDRFLCWPCVEERLGRKLVKEDLQPRRLTDNGSDRRLHDLDAAGGGDVGVVDGGDLLGPCPSCGADLHVGYAKNPLTGRVARMIMHTVPFCTYYGETDPATIEADVCRALGSK